MACSDNQITCSLCESPYFRHLRSLFHGLHFVGLAIPSSSHPIIHPSHPTLSFRLRTIRIRTQRQTRINGTDTASTNLLAKTLILRALVARTRRAGYIDHHRLRREVAALGWCWGAGLEDVVESASEVVVCGGGEGGEG